MKIKIKRKLKESSGVGGVHGAVGGVPVSTEDELKKFNANEEKLSKLKGTRLEEMFSSSTQMGGVRISIVSPDAEHAGHVERSQHQGLRNVMEEIEDTIDLSDPSATDKLMGVISDDPEGEEKEVQSPMSRQHPVLFRQILDHGYEITKVLGKGMWGMVFAAEDVDSGGDYVVKVVGVGKYLTKKDKRIDPLDIRRELDNYATISDVASGDERIWKHFPEVYDTWRGSLNNVRVSGTGRNAKVTGKIPVGFIVMEKLVPLTPEESAFIPDLNWVAAKERFAIKDMDLEPYLHARDQSLKAKSYLKPSPDGPEGKGGIESASRSVLDSIARWWESDKMAPKEEEYKDRKVATYEKALEVIEKIKESVSPKFLYRYERYQDVNPEAIDFLIKKRLDYITAIYGSDDGEYRDKEFDPHILDGFRILQNDVADAPYVHLVLLDLITALIKAARYHTKEYVKEHLLMPAVEGIAVQFINGIRSATTIPVHHKPSDVKKNKSLHGQKNFGPEAKELFTAFKLLYDKSGIYPRDVHDANVMKREGSGDIVVVDLGMFGTDPNWVPEDEQETQEKETMAESRKCRIKVLTNTKK
jgi:serine/threonine protein kinase